MNTIGRYELLERLGQGGMGVVYRAFDPLLQRVVALKLIGAMDANAELKERFFREARAAGQLAHKNIITIHDLGEHEGQPFLAMELLEGQDLQQWTAAHIPMTLARKLELATEVCAGIEYAHLHGVVHRDIKPANIFITKSGTAKLLDFGLARLITSELTNSNMMMGTLNYMAPEQVRGERADHRSDIFSTGVVLYELLGGRKAFEGDSFAATLYKILQDEPVPLRSLDAELPAELIMVVERALEKTREARYQHMSEMLADLDVYRQQLMLRDSPAFGRPASDVTRPGSDVRRLSAAGPAPPMSNAAGSDGARMASNAQTFAASAAPPPATPVPASPQVVDGTPSPVPVSPPVRRTPMLVAAIAAVIVLGAFATWMMRRDAPPPAAVETQGAVPSAAAQQELTNRLDQASQALQAGDGASALRHAEAVLAIDPNHPEGRRVRDRAQQISDTVSRRLGSARDHLAAGRFDEASRAAGEALAVEPGNAEARRLMDEGAAKSAGKGVDEARTRTTRARNAATAAAAPKLAAAAYGAALSAEREAASLHGRGRHAEAMAKFWEATGLFRSAEIAAQTEAAVRTARAQSAPPARPAAESTPRETSVPPAAPKPAPAPPPPVTPEPGTSGLPLPTSSLPSAPQIPPAAPPPAAQTPPAEPSTPPVSPTAGIKEVLDRYEAALESQSLEALKRLWPSLGGAQESAIRHEFQNANRIEVEILNPQITVTGSTATATFIRRYRLHTVDGQRPESETRTTMTLRRSGTAWTIEGMRFEAIR